MWICVKLMRIGPAEDSVSDINMPSPYGKAVSYKQTQPNCPSNLNECLDIVDYVWIIIMHAYDFALNYMLPDGITLN